MSFLILKKEMKSFFQNPLTFLIAGVIALIAGWMFFNLLVNFANSIQGMDVDQRYNYDFLNAVIIKFFGNLNFLLLFLAPILSMKIIAEELNSGTINLLYTSKVTYFEILMNKYLSLLLQGIFFISFSLSYFFILGKADSLDYGIILTGYLGLILNFSLYLSIGLFASSLSKNLMISALICFCIIMFIWSLTLFSQMISNYMVSTIVKYFSVIHHFEAITKGRIDLSTLCFYLSGIFLFTYLSSKSLKIRAQV